MLKNKKLVLSSIAIVMALVVSSIFVNFTLAKDDAGTSKGGSGTTSSITGLTNIDLIVQASVKTGEKYNIVQILPDTESAKASADTKYKAMVEKGTYTVDGLANEYASEQTKIANGQMDSSNAQFSDYKYVTDLWKYVYDSQFFKRSVFDAYTTLDSTMKDNCIVLTTCTVGQLNDMDDDAQEILGSADFIYIAANDINSYASAGTDISQDLYSWLDAYATADGYPLAINPNALCKKADSITGNNDTYRMGALAYKVMTKDMLARMDNILVTSDDFFATLYEDVKKNGGTYVTNSTLYDFIEEAGNKDSTDVTNFYNSKTYYIWDTSSNFYDDFLAGHTENPSPSIGSLAGSSADRQSDPEAWSYDNAKILVISDQKDATLVNTLKDSASVTESQAGVYTYDEATGVWKVDKTKANRSKLTSSLYLDGTKSDTTRNIPSGADIYVLSPDNLAKSFTTEGSKLSAVYMANSGIADVQTTTLRGEVHTGDGVTLSKDNAYVYLLVSTVSEEGTTAGTTIQTISSGTDIVKTKLIPVDASGNEIADTDTTTPVDHYTYSFKQLSPDYTYQVIIDENAFVAVTDPDAGTAESTIYYGVAADDETGATDFIAGKDQDQSYSYRETGMGTSSVKNWNTVVTKADFDENVSESGKATSTADLTARYADGQATDAVTSDTVMIDTADKAVSYISARHNEYKLSEAEYADATSTKVVSSLNLKDYDVVVIDSGTYNQSIGSTALASLEKAVRDDGVVFIVSSDAKGGSSKKDDDGSNSGGIIYSPDAKSIADVINAATYKDGNDNKFKVLEIQPDYPIDLDVAAKNATLSGKTYTKRSTGPTNSSDGGAITGDYYTVPSDVVSGKAKEELPENTEYYQFDLTKAKLAEALEDVGVSYADIELTQVSTEELIGMKDDIAATYDLVYIGGDISAMDRTPTETYAHIGFLFDIWDNSNDTYTCFPTFLMYYHTGILNTTRTGDYAYQGGATLMAAPYKDGVTYKTYTLLAENGNDLTQTKYDELIEYVNSGKPVIVSDEIAKVYDKMMGYNVTSNTDNVKTLSNIQLMQGYWWTDDGQLERKNYYLDPSSRMYDLVAVIRDRSRQSDTSLSGSVLWSYDSDCARYIDDPEGKYGVGLYTAYATGTGIMQNKLDTEAQKESWYNNPGQYFTVYKRYHIGMTDDMKAAVQTLMRNCKNAQRERLTMLVQPTTYKEGIKSTYVKTNRLQFSFQIGGSADNAYYYRLYVDKDKNSKFDSTDYLETNVSEGTTTGTPVYGGAQVDVDVVLDDEFFGSAAWYLEVFRYEGTEERIVATRTGLSKVVNNLTQENKSEINVLQVQTMAQGQNVSGWSNTDNLYFDLGSQFAHKLVKYNFMADEDKSNAASKQYATFGRHENTFGIVEYDTSTGDDDYYSNLANVLYEDYDINLDMVIAARYPSYNYNESGLSITTSTDLATFTTSDENGKAVTDTYDCLDTWVEEAQILKKGNKVEGHTQSDYEDMAATQLIAYESATSKTEKAKKELDDYLQGAIDLLKSDSVPTNLQYMTQDATYGKPGITWPINTFFAGFNGIIQNKEDVVELLEYLIDSGNYYMIFWQDYSNRSGTWANNDNVQAGYCTSDEVGDIGFGYGVEFRKLFMAYRDAKDAELEAKELYTTYLRRSYGDEFLTKMYSILVLGPSDSFGRYLIDVSDDTCEYILKYVSDGGDLFFFHDTMTPYANYGAVNLTKKMLDVVGMNRFHVDLTDKATSYEVTTQKMGTKTVQGKMVQLNDNNGIDVKWSWGSIVHVYVEDSGYIYVPWWRADEKYGWEKNQNYEFFTSSEFINSFFKGNEQAFGRLWVEKGDDIVDLYRDHTYIIYKWAEKSVTYSSTSYTSVEFKYPNVAENKKDLYYMTPYSFNDNLGSGLINSINANYADAHSDTPTKITDTNKMNLYVSGMAMTPLYNATESDGTTSRGLPYVYAQTNLRSVAWNWNDASNQDESGYGESANASQLNEGLVTLYPFAVSSKLNISGTHQQAYALDLENEDITVWYTLAGTNNVNNSKYRSSKYAASPGDAMEAYFIYTTSYGSGAITYCGAGHTTVTGQKTNNNDERKLFINVIINSAEAVAKAPEITCYQPKQTYAAEDELERDLQALDETANKVYTLGVESKNDTPEFDLKVTRPDSDTKVRLINIYYDLDYSDYSVRPGYDSDTDVMITTITEQDKTKLSKLGNDVLDIKQAITSDLKGLSLKDEYFAQYGGTYTYIVIEVYYEGKMKPVYAMIKIKVSDPLFELTENTIGTPYTVIEDFLTEKKFTMA